MAAKPKKLTARQQLFVAEYLVDLDGAAAMRRIGCKAKKPEEQASRFMAMPHVLAAIQAKMVKRIERTDVTADRVVLELARIAFVDPRRVMNWKGGSVRLVDSAQLSDDDAAAIAEVGEQQYGVKLKLHDKVAALRLLSQHLGILVEKHEHTGKDGAPLPATPLVAAMTPDQFKDTVRELLAEV